MAEASALIGLIQSAKAAGDVLSALLGLQISAEVSGKIAEANKHIIEMQTHVMAVQRDNSALVARIGELEEQAVRAKRQHGDLENYEMKQVGHDAFVYAMKPDHDVGKPPHWLCPNCFSNGHKSILQHDPSFSFDGECYLCPRCKADVTASKGRHPSN